VTASGARQSRDGMAATDGGTAGAGTGEGREGFLVRQDLTLFRGEPAM